jgi:hypothetical protein
MICPYLIAKMTHDDAVKKTAAQTIFNNVGRKFLMLKNAHMNQTGHIPKMVYPDKRGIVDCHWPFNMDSLPKSII